jgi:DNA-binding SARP family transcriptional activator/DNA-binding XRE family transcriptional regulator
LLGQTLILDRNRCGPGDPATATGGEGPAIQSFSNHISARHANVSSTGPGEGTYDNCAVDIGRVVNRPSTMGRPYGGRGVVVGGPPDPATVAALIRDLRRRSRLTQAQLADGSGLSIRAVRDIECGRVANPQGRTLDRLADALALCDSERERLYRHGAPVPAAQPEGPRVELLGRLTISDGTGPLALTSPVQRGVLGLLALRSRTFVSCDEIVDTVWGHNPPRTCLTQLHNAIGRLRTLVEPDRESRASGRVVHSATGGYQLDLTDDYIDARQFEALVAEAARRGTHGDHEAALAHLDQALRCWRGAVLADASERLRTHPAALALARQRLTAVLRCADLAANSARPDTAITWLTALAAEEPLHEALHARLMLALAGAGDRAAALRVHAELRGRLAEDLGVDPGEEIGQAYQRILNPPPRPAATPTQAIRGLLDAIGWYHSLLDEHRQALTTLRTALALLEELADGAGQAATWDSLSHAQLLLEGLDHCDAGKVRELLGTLR